MWLVREWLAWFSPRRWRYSWRQAAHVVRVTEAGARGQDFYGSMTLAGERGWLAAPEVAHSGWWGQTAADLAPEALEAWGPQGPSASYEEWLAEGRAETRGWPISDAPDHRGPGWPVNGADSGPGDLTSLAPGPDTTRLAWLDRQLDAHAVWARRMRGQVTGWGLEGAAAA